jgi:hypothetical protein
VFPAILNNYGTLNTPPIEGESHFEPPRTNPPTAKQITENQEARQKEREEQEEELYEAWMEEGHWSICTYSEEKEAAKQKPAEFTVKSGETISFGCFAGGPMWRLSFQVGEAETKSVRIFARAFERGKV